MAVNFAHKCRAKKVILNHFSQRYQSHNRLQMELSKEGDGGNKDVGENVKSDLILLNEGRHRAKILNLSANEGEYVDIAQDLKLFEVRFSK